MSSKPPSALPKNCRSRRTITASSSAPPASYDPVYDINNVDRGPFPLDRAAVRDIGTDFRLLDAYFFASPEIFGHHVDVRVLATRR